VTTFFAGRCSPRPLPQRKGNSGSAFRILQPARESGRRKRNGFQRIAAVRTTELSTVADFCSALSTTVAGTPNGAMASEPLSSKETQREDRRSAEAKYSVY